MIIGETPEQRQERENISDELRRKSERTAETSGEPRQFIDKFTNTHCPLVIVDLPDGRLGLALRK